VHAEEERVCRLPRRIGQSTNFEDGIRKGAHVVEM
jgi:hypothetical protein